MIFPLSICWAHLELKQFQLSSCLFVSVLLFPPHQSSFLLNQPIRLIITLVGKWIFVFVSHFRNCFKWTYSHPSFLKVCIHLCSQEVRWHWSADSTWKSVLERRLQIHRHKKKTSYHCCMVFNVVNGSSSFRLMWTKLSYSCKYKSMKLLLDIL